MVPLHTAIESRSLGTWDILEPFALTKSCFFGIGSLLNRAVSVHSVNPRRDSMEDYRKHQLKDLTRQF